MRLTITATLAFLCAGLFIPVGAQTGSVSDREQVLKAEEEFRQAKMKNDTVALERLVADEYYGMNQWGAKRDKAQLIALFHDFQTEALVPTNVTVRLSGDHAIIDGTMTESSGGGMRFTYTFLRVFLRHGSEWKLLSSVQFIPSNP
jgi:hypothetical protein